MKDISLKKIGRAIVIFPILYALASVFLLTRAFNYSLYLPSSYRVIYVPIYFWVLSLCYLCIIHPIFMKEDIPISSYIRKGIIALFFFHLYLLLGNLVAHLFKNENLIAGVYFLYIKSVFLMSTIALNLVTVKQTFFAKDDREHRPLIYLSFTVASFYFLCLSAVSGHSGYSVLIGFSIAVGVLLNLVKGNFPLEIFKKAILKDMNIIIIIFTLAFVARFTFGVILVDNTTRGPRGYDGYLYASDDGLTYDATANKILKDPSVLKNGGVVLWGHWDEFYSIFLAALYKLFGRNFYILTSIQSIFGALIPVFAFSIGKLIFSRTVGIIASVALSFKGGLIMLSSYMGHEAVWLPLLYLLALLLTVYFKTPERSGILRDVAMGIILGIVCLFRSMYLYFLPYVGLWQILFFRNIRIVRKIAHIAIVAMVCLVIIFGTFHALNNRIQPLNKDKAMHLWYTSRPVYPFQNLGNERLDVLGVNFIGDPIGSLKNIARRPMAFIILAAKIYPLRVVAYLETYQFGSFDPIYMVNPANIKNRFASTLEFYFTLFFIIGLVGCIAKRRILSSPIFLVIVFHLLFYCFLLFQPSPRLKETSAPLVYLIGSLGACSTYKFLKG